MRILHLGDEGPQVRDVQQRLLALGYRVDQAELGRFGDSTDEEVRRFQGARSLRVDGLVGADTWGQLVEAGFHLGDRTLYLHAPPRRGDDVRSLQRKLNALGFDAGKEDGVFGASTDQAVREFQRNVGDIPDGVVGLHTLDTLERMRPLDDAPSRAVVREAEELRTMRASLEGQIVAVDPGHAPRPGEEDRHLDMARALAEELSALGAKAELLRGEGDDPSATDRARSANDIGSALCLSMHLGGGLPEASGPTCSYFGSDRTHSPTGRHLAELVLEELEREFGVRGRLQRLSVTMLRETRMPAVQIEPLFLTNRREAEVIAGAAFATRVGRAVAVGVRRFFREAD